MATSIVNIGYTFRDEVQKNKFHISLNKTINITHILDQTAQKTCICSLLILPTLHCSQCSHVLLSVTPTQKHKTKTSVFQKSTLNNKYMSIYLQY